MAISLVHAFASAKADPPDTSLIKPSNWNAEHSLTMASSRLIGRTTASTGAAEEISVGGALTFALGALSLPADAITNTYLANMATQTFKGRTTAGTGDPEDLTVTQATAMLNTFTTSLKGLAPASGGGSTNFLRADGTWAEPPGSSGATFATAAQYWSNQSGNLALSPEQVWISAAEQSVSAGSTITLDFTAGFNFAMTANQNFTLANPTNQKAGQSGYFAVTQDGTGSRTITFGSHWKFPTGVSKVLSTAAGSVDVIFYQIRSNGFIICSLVKAYA